MFAPLLVLVLTFIRGYQAQICESQLLVLTKGCICVGDVLEFECSTVGSGTTIWEGSAFSDCTGNRIVLRHSQLTEDSTSNTCNDGAIVAHSSGNETTNCYISQLNVTVIDSSLDGNTVICTHVGSQSTAVLGNYTIVLTSDQNPYPPPDNVRVIDLHQYAQTGQLTFKWSSATTYCPSAYYAITDINCGVCPTSTLNNNVTCQNVALGNTCNFVVRRVACENVVSSPSHSVSVTLKVPSVDAVNIVPLYDDETMILKSVLTTFETESFSVTDGIDSSATSYTITYTNPRYGHLICDSVTIPTSRCVNGMCSYILNLSSSNCSAFSEVNITVFGTNILGNGASSNPVTIGYFNQIVRVRYNPFTPEVICTFLNEKSHATSEKRCSILYGPGNNCVNASLRSEGTANALHSSVGINLQELPPRHNLVGNQFCFIITASDGDTNTMLEGNFNAGCDQQQLSDGTALSSDNTRRCGAPLHSVGIMNGTVCFTGIDTGATAVYTCSNLDSGTILKSVRTCLPNGTWNGTILHCTGPFVSVGIVSSTQSLGITVSLSVLLLITIALLVALIVVIVILSRAKAKVEHNLRQARSNAIYDEVLSPPSVIESSKNVAYTSVT